MFKEYPKKKKRTVPGWEVVNLLILLQTYPCHIVIISSYRVIINRTHTHIQNICSLCVVCVNVYNYIPQACSTLREMQELALSLADTSNGDSDQEELCDVLIDDIIPDLIAIQDVHTHTYIYTHTTHTHAHTHTHTTHTRTPHYYYYYYFFLS